MTTEENNLIQFYIDQGMSREKATETVKFIISQFKFPVFMPKEPKP